MEIDFVYLCIPSALQGVLEYFKQAYDNPPIYIHENGLSLIMISDTAECIIDGYAWVDYMRAYIGAMLDAVRNGSNARGYFSWSFLDLYELMDGYKSRYGLYYVDMDDPDSKRYPKLSAKWSSDFLKGTSNSSKESFGACNLNITVKHQPQHFSQ